MGKMRKTVLSWVEESEHVTSSGQGMEHGAWSTEHGTWRGLEWRTQQSSWLTS